ncbi:C40 family peptidase [Paenibacillus sp. y28]|uniref:C40 family peptidase n=1 Tax=Paenibacillus sp. y28 TaxID=3129110 RepID=UPI0030193CD6
MKKWTKAIALTLMLGTSYTVAPPLHTFASSYDNGRYEWNQNQNDNLYNGDMGDYGYSYGGSQQETTNNNQEAAGGQDDNSGAAWVQKADTVIAKGNKFLGRPYQFGAEYGQTNEFDCSSFTKTVYNGLVDLPRSSAEQAGIGQWVAKSDLRKGDLVFFKTKGSSSNKVTHVAIYVGNGTLLHTYGEGGVRYTDMNTGSWNERYVTARRVLN